MIFFGILFVILSSLIMIGEPIVSSGIVALSFVYVVFCIVFLLFSIDMFLFSNTVQREVTRKMLSAEYEPKKKWLLNFGYISLLATSIGLIAFVNVIIGILAFVTICALYAIRVLYQKYIDELREKKVMEEYKKLTSKD